MKPLNLSRQYIDIGYDLDLAIGKVLKSGRFINGPVVEKFERHWAAYANTQYCIGVGSGTDAITIALEAAGIEGKVIVPANSAYPTAEAVVRAGCKPLFCDIDPDTYTLDIERVKTLLTVHQVQAIVPVHLYGHPCDMDAIMEVATNHALFVLEDCAHAHGTEYVGWKVGGLGHAAAWSFNPTKILGAAGDAGAITTNDDGLAFRARQLANHGRVEKNTHERIGHNSRLDALQAAVLDVKLTYLDDWLAHRRTLAKIYRERLNGSVELPLEATWARHAYHQFVIRLPRRDKVRSMLFMAYDIETGVHYPRPLNEQPALKQYQSGETPVTKDYARQVLSLPVNESLYQTEAHAICDALLGVLE